MAVGKRIEELHLDEVTVVEKPDSPEYYPDLHNILLLPFKARVEKYGPKWMEKSDELANRVEVELRDWITNSGFPHDIVFDLHDNTPHETYRELADRFSREQNYGYVTDKGRLAVTPRVLFFEAIYYCKYEDGMLDNVLSSFKPRPYVPNKIEKLPQVLSGVPPLNDFEIGVEFHPAGIRPFSGNMRQYSITEGSRIMVQLLEHIRRSIIL